MTIVREEENGNNGHHAGGVWRGHRCSSSLDTRAGALARFGLIDRSIGEPPCARRCRRTEARNATVASRGIQGEAACARANVTSSGLRPSFLGSLAPSRRVRAADGLAHGPNIAGKTRRSTDRTQTGGTEPPAP